MARCVLCYSACVARGQRDVVTGGIDMDSLKLVLVSESEVFSQIQPPREIDRSKRHFAPPTPHALHRTSGSSRRKKPRYSFMCRADWDFFTTGTGNKAGYLENISEGGCLLRTTELIEHRRWIRMLVQEPKSSLFFTVVGRIIRREDRMEPWHSVAERTDNHKTQSTWVMTLHRYGIEFVQPLNSVVLERIEASSTRCTKCGRARECIPAAQALVTAATDRDHCVVCQLREACQNLLSPADVDLARARKSTEPLLLADFLTR